MNSPIKKKTVALTLAEYKMQRKSILENRKGKHIISPQNQLSCKVLGDATQISP
jgi:hypothetical protein